METQLRTSTQSLSQSPVSSSIGRSGQDRDVGGRRLLAGAGCCPGRWFNLCLVWHIWEAANAAQLEPAHPPLSISAGMPCPARRSSSSGEQGYQILHFHWQVSAWERVSPLQAGAVLEEGRALGKGTAAEKESRPASRAHRQRAPQGPSPTQKGQTQTLKASPKKVPKCLTGIN